MALPVTMNIPEKKILYPRAGAEKNIAILTRPLLQDLLWRLC